MLFYQFLHVHRKMNVGKFNAETTVFSIIFISWIKLKKYIQKQQFCLKSFNGLELYFQF